MFKILKIKDDVRVPPTKFDLEVKQAIKESLGETIEGTINPEVGIFLCVTDVIEVSPGRIIPEDGAIFYPSTYKILTYTPELNEVVIGEIVDITEFGAFTRIGPIDALIHVSQIMDDRISYDPKNAIFTGKKNKNKLSEGNIVRARIVSISLGKGRNKISLTMRQECLGAVEWIEKEKKKKAKKSSKPKTEKKK